MPEIERQPPFNLDAEESVLGSLILDGECLSRIQAVLRPEDFYREKNAWVYGAMLALHDRGLAIDQVMVAHELSKSDGRLEAIGGPAYLAYCVSVTPTSVHVAHYAKIISDCSWHRQLIALSGNLAEQGYSGKADLDKWLAEFWALRRPEIRLMSPGEVADMMIARYNPISDTTESIPYGFERLDALTGGAWRGQLILIGARPGTGKTDLLRSMAMWMNYTWKVLLCTAEMKTENIVDRIVASEAKVDLVKVMRRNFTPEEHERIQEVTATTALRHLYYDDTEAMTTRHIEAAARRLKLSVGLDVVMVDYIQLLADQPSKAASSNERVAYISRRLKGIARELDVVVIAASQLNRQSTYGKPRPPTIADLRDSGALEQDADLIILMYRPEADLTKDEWDDKGQEQGWQAPYPKGKVEIYLAKQRQGGHRGRLNIIWNDKRKLYVQGG